ncbi:hypothetical protein EV363DRAFT_1300964 [Boletus edulis]|nr:hypothetical protein EV363DRAFT_1300964 [Boletus edulis]
MSSSENSLPSKSTGSHSSGRSHSIRGIVDPADPVPANKGKGKGKSKSKTKPRTAWTDEETSELIKLLSDNHLVDGFKDEVLNKIVGELNEKFPSQRVPKTGKSCCTKWSGIKSEFTLISEIRAASGFHYHDVNGVTVDQYTRAAWLSFCGSHTGATKYEGKAWPYWDAVLPLMPSIGKGTHVRHPAKSKQGKKKIITDIAATPATPFGTVVDPSCTAGPSGVQHDFDVQMDPLNVTNTALNRDPNSIPPSTPSIYLPPPSAASAARSATTSVSQKQKTPCTAGSVAASQTSKRSRPLSVTAQQKVESKAIMQKLTSFLDNVGPALQPVTLASLGLAQTQQPSSTHDTTATSDDYIDHAAEALSSCKLTLSQRNTIADYMSDVQNKRRVKFFLMFDQALHEMWIQNTLTEIQAQKDGMDHDGQ